ncbi:MAG: peptidoglycan bridge formation glycyltransferase FemA/FemB family protein [Dethiobacter sp.]|jgi:lipid II:glycine glycyltransferase (peptidoglycan interpeptide bridge formation enzyme)|nr:peptidoglycan bridge formation glycyltransferase FemA/FemB family protein [Dethiobacter sp.]
MNWRLIKESESARYDSFLAGLDSGDIMQSWSWGEVKNDWRAHRGVVEDKDGQILAAASLLVRNLPLPGRTVAYVPRGPALVDYSDSNLLAFTLNSLAGLARKEKAILLKIDPAVPEHSPAVLETLSNMGFTRTRQTGEFGGLQPRHTFRLSLDNSIEDIFSRFAKKVRYKIKYAPQRGLVFKSNDETSIEDFFRVLAKTGNRSDFIVRSPQYFRRLYPILKKEGRILLLTGYIAEEPVVSSLTLIFAKTAWAAYGGQDDTHRNLYTYHAMNWERIAWAKSRGAKWFDFYGVPGIVGESHPLHGLYHFKQSFGGDYVSYIGEWDLPLSKPLYLLWELGVPAYRSTVSRALKLFRR